MDTPASVQELIGRMAVEERRLLREEKSLSRFLHVYRLVTERVAYQAQHTGSFNDSSAMEEIDLVFAALYFDALEAYLTRGEKRKPWRTYFTACEACEEPIVHVLLGINAHVNGDLALAIRRTGFEAEEDFFHVNGILRDTTPAIIKYLADNNDLYGELGQFFSTRFIDEAVSILKMWRRDVWTIAHSDASKQAIHDGTERLAADLRDTVTQSPLQHPLKIRQRIESYMLSDYI